MLCIVDLRCLCCVSFQSSLDIRWCWKIIFQTVEVMRNLTTEIDSSEKSKQGALQNSKSIYWIFGVLLLHGSYVVQYLRIKTLGHISNNPQTSITVGCIRKKDETSLTFFFSFACSYFWNHWYDITKISVIKGLPPNHWYAKWHGLTVSFRRMA